MIFQSEYLVYDISRICFIREIKVMLDALIYIAIGGETIARVLGGV